MIRFGDEAGRHINPNHQGTICAWYGDTIIARCEQNPKQGANWKVTVQTQALPADPLYAQNALAMLFTNNVVALQAIFRGISFSKPK